MPDANFAFVRASMVNKIIHTRRSKYDFLQLATSVNGFFLIQTACVKSMIFFILLRFGTTSYLISYVRVENAACFES